MVKHFLTQPKTCTHSLISSHHNAKALASSFHAPHGRRLLPSWSRQNWFSPFSSALFRLRLHFSVVTWSHFTQVYIYILCIYKYSIYITLLLSICEYIQTYIFSSYYAYHVFWLLPHVLLSVLLFLINFLYVLLGSETPIYI